ncbi:MAG: ABC transporter permease subunit [Chloroflexi bacterium]|jgi:ABC-2 type transport system permease protein|nr:ABC transporter permease subunit [Chloroflexota bacterium]
MRNIWAIARRELYAYFTSPIAYVIGALFLLISGFLFSLILNLSSEATMRPLFGNLSVIFLFAVPFLTMRLLAEEARTGTLELLLTAPVRDSQLVLGKFLGALLLVLAILACTAIYPIILLLAGNPDRGPILAGYLGIILQAAAFLAIGLFASSLTQNQIIAAMLTFVILLLLWLSDALGNYTGGRIGDLFRFLSITRHLDEFPRGIIDTRHIVYFLSAIVVALFLTVQSVQSRRWR